MELLIGYPSFAFGGNVTLGYKGSSDLEFAKFPPFQFSLAAPRLFSHLCFGC
jgi:hypothetical protein